jgi:hypothetical protein
MTGIINQVPKPSEVQTQPDYEYTTLQQYPLLLYGSETWTLKKKDKARITAAETKFFRKTAKYTLYDHKRTQDITKKLKTQLVFKKNQPRE